MKGDFTRFTHTPSKGYSSVRLQQGRVALDADWNEQIDIGITRERQQVQAAIGRAAGPLGASGFTVSVVNQTLALSAGSYYVDGIRCELRQPTLVREQPSLPGFDPTAGLEPGRYAVYLDVWERHVTSIEDPHIQERALGGADHATRTQVVAQVRLKSLDHVGPAHECERLSDRTALAAWIEGERGRLAASVDPAPTRADPCIVPSDAGYRGLENQLYRVEIHRPGDAGSATFKWSRDNASVATAWLGQPDPNRPELIEVADLGPDSERAFSAGRLVELESDRLELNLLAGTLADVKEADQASRTLELENARDAAGHPASVQRDDDVHHPRVRCWEKCSAVDRVDVIDGGAGWAVLDAGIRVRFDQHPDKHYRTGDYWLIPARTIGGVIEWQPDGPQMPHGVDHHYACLAVVKHEAGALTVERNYQQYFPPSTQLTQLRYVSGDGQPGVLGQRLPAPLQVQVSNGGTPVEGATVTFEIRDQPRNDAALLDPSSGATGSRLTLKTSTSGIAQVIWKLAGQAAGVPQQDLIDQQAHATLLDGCDQETAQTIVFNAHHTLASEVGYAPACEHLQNAGVSTVQAALDALCHDRTLFYVAGTGQAAEFGQPLPVRLTVRVAHQGHAIRGAVVHFAIIDLSGAQAIDEATGGTLAGAATAADTFPWPPNLGSGTRAIKIHSDEHGLASVTWIYGRAPGAGIPGVQATLLDATGRETTSIVRFGAVKQDLVRITALSWIHDRIAPGMAHVRLFAFPDPQPALVFRFSADVRILDEDDTKVRLSDAHRALEVLVRNSTSPDGMICRCSLIGRVVPLKPIEVDAKDGLLPTLAAYQEQPAAVVASTFWAFVSQHLAGGSRELIVRLRGNLVESGSVEHRRAIDADLILGRLPTGNGTEGGVFESWLWTPAGTLSGQGSL